MASLNDVDIDDLKAGYALVLNDLEKVTGEFYKELFNRYPAVQPMFKNIKISQQKEKLASALRLVMSTLDKPDDLVSALQEMGRRHQDYGATADLYGPVAGTLIDVMKAAGGNNWTEKMSEAWATALNVIAEIMLSGYEADDDVTQTDTNTPYGLKSNIKNQSTENKIKEAEEDKMATEIEELKNELRNLKSTVEGSATAIMTCDRDLTIT